MNREAIDSLDRQALVRLVLSQAEAIEALRREIAALRARVEALEAENATLRARLDLPPKTPDNSSTPPSLGRKASGEATRRPKSKPHSGSHRALHPNPTGKRNVMASACQHCGRDVSGLPQIASEAYDHIEIPATIAEVTRITLFGGTCPWLAPSGSRPRRRKSSRAARRSG